MAHLTRVAHLPQWPVQWQRADATRAGLQFGGDALPPLAGQPLPAGTTSLYAPPMSIGFVLLPNVTVPGCAATHLTQSGSPWA